MTIGRLPSRAEGPRDIEAVEARQAEVEDHEIRVAGPGELQGGSPVAGR